MIAVRHLRGRFLLGLLLAVWSVPCLLSAAAGPAPHWVGTWATAPRSEEWAKEPVLLPEATLRQVVHTSLGGRQVRLRLSNVFGTTALTFHSAHLALAGPAGSILPGTDLALRFNGATAVSIPPGACLLSDPVDFDLPPLADVAVSLHLQRLPAVLTMHHGSRTTSYVQPGDALAAPALPAASKVEHWYFISGLDVLSAAPAAAVVALGDSITDGRGSTTDLNNRWTDALARRLQAGPRTAAVGVLNQGIGGNRLLRDGLGVNMLARFDRDVLVQTGARWVIVQAGINDIGTRLEARKRGEAFASATEIIGAFEQLIDRAHPQGLRIFGTTITPYAGADFYWSGDGEADRQKINEWIRTSGRFDAVIDFDAALRDPADPSRLASAFDSGDHLHPSPAGYERMAEAVDVNLFKP
jgi:lysophospholipase L1-like esterase